MLKDACARAAVSPSSREIVSAGLKSADSLEDCIGKVDVCIIATPWKEFYVTKLDFSNKVVIDMWRFPSKSVHNASKYIAIGQNSDDGAKFPSEYLDDLSTGERVAAV